MKTYTGTRIVIGVAQILGWICAIIGAASSVSERNGVAFMCGLGVALLVQAFGGVGFAILDLAEDALHTSASKVPISKQELAASHRKIAPTVEAASRPHVPELRPSAR